VGFVSCECCCCYSCCYSCCGCGCGFGFGQSIYCCAEPQESLLVAPVYNHHPNASSPSTTTPPLITGRLTPHPPLRHPLTRRDCAVGDGAAPPGRQCGRSGAGGDVGGARTGARQHDVPAAAKGDRDWEWLCVDGGQCGCNVHGSDCSGRSFLYSFIWQPPPQPHSACNPSTTTHPPTPPTQAYSSGDMSVHRWDVTHTPPGGSIHHSLKVEAFVPLDPAAASAAHISSRTGGTSATSSSKDAAVTSSSSSSSSASTASSAKQSHSSSHPSTSSSSSSGSGDGSMPAGRVVLEKDGPLLPSERAVLTRALRAANLTFTESYVSGWVSGVVVVVVVVVQGAGRGLRLTALCKRESVRQAGVQAISISTLAI